MRSFLSDLPDTTSLADLCLPGTHDTYVPVSRFTLPILDYSIYTQLVPSFAFRVDILQGLERYHLGPFLHL